MSMLPDITKYYFTTSLIDSLTASLTASLLPYITRYAIKLHH